MFHVKSLVTCLAQRYGLDGRQQSQLLALLEGLATDEMAPTTVRDPAQAVDVHLADSLAGLELDLLRQSQTLVDVGAGAGFPGMPLAVALPSAELVLLESQARKCSFMERLCAAAELKNARVVCARVEEWQEGIGGSDVVMARALAPQSVVLEYAAPLLRMGGSLLDWRGQRDATEETTALVAADELGLRLVEIRHVEPYQGARHHHLHVYEKVHETPARYPRRAGVARKRPLGC